MSSRYSFIIQLCLPSLNHFVTAMQAHSPKLRDPLIQNLSSISADFRRMLHTFSFVIWRHSTARLGSSLVPDGTTALLNPIFPRNFDNTYFRIDDDSRARDDCTDKILIPLEEHRYMLH